jgi:hypothetical protein
MGQHISTHEEIGNTYRTVVGKTKGKQLLARSSLNGRIILKLILKEI